MDIIAVIIGLDEILARETEPRTHVAVIVGYFRRPAGARKVCVLETAVEQCLAGIRVIPCKVNARSLDGGGNVGYGLGGFSCATRHCCRGKQSQISDCCFVRIFHKLEIVRETVLMYGFILWNFGCKNKQNVSTGAVLHPKTVSISRNHNHFNTFLPSSGGIFVFT